MMRTGNLGETHARRGRCGSARAPVSAGYDLEVVGHQQAHTCPVNAARCDQVARIDVDCNAKTATGDAERAT